MSKKAAQLGLILLLTACAPGPSPMAEPSSLSSSLNSHSPTRLARAPQNPLASAPSWVTQDCRAYWSDTALRRSVVCAVGSTPKHPNRVAARETAIARARAAIARSLTVTIESLVRVTESGENDEELRTIVHQLSSTSLRGVQTETTWRSDRGEVHALVSLGLERVQHSVRNTPSLPRATREGIAERAAAAFAEMDAAFENESTAELRGNPHRAIRRH